MMNLEQAHQILTRHKEGSHAYSLLTVTQALFLTGDLPDEPEPLGTHGEDSWREDLCLEQG